MTIVQDATRAAQGSRSLPEVLRTVAPIVVEVADDDRFLVGCPHVAKRLRVQRHVLDLLLDARAGIHPAALPATQLGAAERLATLGFLVEENVALPSPWAEWGTAAWSFHQRTRDVAFFEKGDTAELDAYLEDIAQQPRPSSFRWQHPDSILLLPRVRTLSDVGYFEVLQRRRTHRSFDSTPLELDTFSDMLHYCFAPLRFADAGPMGVLQLKAAASGGARHECEAFVAVLDVEHVRPGLYGYDGVRHGLVPVDESVGREEMERLTFGQGFFETAAFGVFTVAVADRMSWKYRMAKAYKLLLHNVGHVAQVFSMTATALGLGAALTGAIRESEVDALLGLDVPREFSTFALACGRPRRQADGMPAAIRVPDTAPEAY